MRDTRLAAQLGGAAGTLAALGDRGLDVLARFARELGLAEPALPWHTDAHAHRRARRRARRGGGAVAKVAGDVVLLAQTEVGEVREGGDATAAARRRCRTSATRSRRSPRSPRARQAPGLVATLLAAMEHEHERAAGAWHAEWAPLRELLRATGSAAAWLRDCLERLEVDAERMRANLDDAHAGRARRAAHRPSAGPRGAPTPPPRRALARGRSARWPSARAPSTSTPRRPSACSTRASYVGATDALVDRACARAQ